MKRLVSPWYSKAVLVPSLTSLLIMIVLVAINTKFCTAAVTEANVLDWAKKVGDKFASDVGNTMRINDLQKLYDESSKTITWKEGTVEAASAAAQLSIILTHQDEYLSQLVATVQKNPMAPILALPSTDSETFSGKAYFTSLMQRELVTDVIDNKLLVLNKDWSFDPTLTPWFSAAVTGPKDVFIVADLEAYHTLSTTKKEDFVSSINGALDTISPNDNLWMYGLTADGELKTFDEACSPSSRGSRGTNEVIQALKKSTTNLNSSSSSSTASSGSSGSRGSNKWADAFQKVFGMIYSYRDEIDRGIENIGTVLLFTTSEHGPRKSELVFRINPDTGYSCLDGGGMSNSSEICNIHDLPIFTYRFDKSSVDKLMYACDTLGSAAVVPDGIRKMNKLKNTPAHYFLHLAATPSPDLEEVTSSVQFFGGPMGKAVDKMTMMRSVYSVSDPPVLLGVLTVDNNFYTSLLDTLHLISGHIGRNSFPVLTTPQGDTIYHKTILNKRGELQSEDKHDVGRYEYFEGFAENVREPFLKGLVGSKYLRVFRSLPKGDAATEGFDGEWIDTRYFYTPIGKWDLRLLLVFDENDLQTEDIQPVNITTNKLIISQLEDYIATDKGKKFLANLKGSPSLNNDGNCPDSNGAKFGNCKPDAYCARVENGVNHPVGTVAGAPPCVIGSSCVCESHRWPVGLTARGTAVIHIAPISLIKSSRQHTLSDRYSGGKHASEKQSLTYNMTEFLNREKCTTNPSNQKINEQALQQIPYCNEIAKAWIKDAQRDDTHKDTVWIYYATYTGITAIYPSNNWGFGWDPTQRPWYHRARASGSRTLTAVISTPYVDGGGAGLMNTLASPVWDSKNRIQGVMGFDFLYPMMDAILPSISQCSAKVVRDIGKSGGQEVACWLVELSGLLLTHSDFLASKEDKDKWAGSTGTDGTSEGEWPIENVFVGKKEPDLAQGLIDKKVFIPQRSQDPTSESFVNYYVADLSIFSASNPLVKGEITVDTAICLDVFNAPGKTIKWFITPVKDSNSLLLVADGYKRKDQECTEKVEAPAAEPLKERLKKPCIQDTMAFKSRSRSWQTLPVLPRDQHCRRCYPGSYSNAPEKKCTECESGKYSDILGAGGCKLCPRGRYAENRGLESCTICPVGRYSLKIAANTSLTCLKDKPCPIGANCTFSDGLREINLLPLEGYWHPSPESKVFISCKHAFIGHTGKKLAKLRCCRNKTIQEILSSPDVGEDLFDNVNALKRAGKTEEARNMMSRGMQSLVPTICDLPLYMSNKSVDSQCSEGYAGNLCSKCAEGYVKRGTMCYRCDSKPSLGMALVGLFGMTVVVFLVVVALMLPCSLRRIFHSGSGDGSTIQGQIKILMTFMQLTSTMAVTFDSVPWSPRFLTMSWLFSISNLDLSGLLIQGSCEMAVDPVDKFVVSLLTPIFTFVAIFVAFGIMKVAIKEKTLPDNDQATIKDEDNDGIDDSENAQIEGWELWAVTIKIILFTIMLLYPGQTTAIFAALRCVTIEGLGNKGDTWLQADLNVKCWGDVHTTYGVLAIVGAILYIFATPLALLFQVHRVLKIIRSPTTRQKRKTILTFMYGGIFSQFEPEFWYFQFVIMAAKMLMTGLLSIVAPGTPVQMLCAFFVMASLFVSIIKYQPFNNDLDDHMAVLTKIGLSFTVLLGK